MSAVVAAIAIGAIGVGVMAYQGHVAQGSQEKAMEQQKRAQEQALAQAQSEQRRSEMAQNAANRRQPSVAGIMERAAAGGGGTGTMLTGPSGVDPNALALGKNTLLGG